ncbi:hypothetical protein [Aquimarina aquimarini]|uniref:hypothetical protein n=1 Tax=Aquimarina aquimarini TaxID=1191734 RepID=UPI000D5620C0|nr:hypothetical protein [Aquimarina aquimarini]
MAPLKFEDKMKEKLGQRTIQPSANSWERLEDKLSNVQGKQRYSKRNLWYKVVAICVVMLITTAIVVDKNSEEEPTGSQFVDSNKEIIEKEGVEVVYDKVLEKRIQDNTDVLENDTTANKLDISLSQSKKAIHKERIVSNATIFNDTVDEKIFSNHKYDRKIMVSDKPLHTKKQAGFIDSLVIENKIAGVVAEIKELQKNKIQISDKEIDILLQKAQKEIAIEKNGNSVMVNASILLQDVEQELDEKFKQRVFEALKRGFQKVKTAVVERNQ